jgi:hypothetical protein
MPVVFTCQDLGLVFFGYGFQTDWLQGYSNPDFIVRLSEKRKKLTDIGFLVLVFPGSGFSYFHRTLGWIDLRINQLLRQK